MNKETFNNIVKYIRELIKGTEFEGHVYCVGGCVRDITMSADSDGDIIKDIDLVVDIRNGGIKLAEFFNASDKLSSDPVTYERFGTAMFRFTNYPEHEIEAVHTRSEKYYDSNSRNPVQDFGTIEDDCMRRDLTINALYINVSDANNSVIDITGKGLDDIRNGIIRTPRDPNETYSDDPLRMLRCIRFATRFGWNIDKDTFIGIINNARRISIISRERIHDELKKILSGERWITGLFLLKKSGLRKHIGLDSYDTTFITAYPDYVNTIVTPTVNENTHILAVTAMLYNDINRKDVMKALKYTNAEIKLSDAIVSLSKYVNAYITGKRTYDLNRMMFEFGNYDINTARSAMVLAALLHYNSSNDDSLIYFLQDTLDLSIDLANGDKPETKWFRNNRIPVTGEDIIAELDVKPGKGIKELLDYVRDFLLSHHDTDPDTLTKEQCISILKSR